jgi:hypothetical protein
MTEKKSWDNIPSLEGLSVDWDYQSEHAADQRHSVRMDGKAVCGLFELKEIGVKIATAREAYIGQLLDLGTGGVSVRMSTPLDPGVPVKFGFFLGTMKILAKGVVKHCQNQGEQFRVGIEFVDLDPRVAGYVAELHASKVFGHRI